MDFDNDVGAAPPARRRKVPSAGRCLLITCGLLGVIVVVAFFGTILYGLKRLFDDARNPHKHLLHETRPDKYPSARTVGPLIDKETRFDVVLTLWARAANEDSLGADEYAEDAKGATGEADPSELALAAMVGLPLVEVRRDPHEVPLFSEVVFEEVSMADKGLEKKVDIQLPLKRFRDAYVYPSDVRAAVSIIPRSPSKLDRLEDFSDWRPDVVMPLDRLTNSLMASRPLNDKGEDDTARWDALERIAASFGLVELFDDPSLCLNAVGTNSTNTSTAEDEEDDVYLWRADDESDPQGEPSKAEHPSITRTRNAHPYLVTRSHVYLIDETRHFHRKDLDMQHRRLRETSCGQLLKSIRPSRYLCNRSYKTNGHWETRLVIHPEEEGGVKEVVYGPYLGSLKQAAGPMDHVALPVNRGNCTTVDPDSLPDTFNFTYTLKFSTLSPGRVLLLDEHMQVNGRPTLNSTREALMAQHDSWEQMSGVFGNSGEGTRPWTRLVLSTIRDLCLGLLVSLLTLIYWYTRTTTTGLDVTAWIIFAVASFAEELSFHLFVRSSESNEFGMMFLGLFFSAWNLIPAFFVLRVIFPFEVKRDGWSFEVKRWKWSHRERVSRRISHTIPWAVRGAVFVAFYLTAFIPGHYNLWLIHPINHTPTPHTSWTESSWFRSLLFAGEYTPYALQALFNERSETFAGQYFLTAWLALVGRAITNLYHLPLVVGRIEVRSGVKPLVLVETGLEVWGVWQAMRFRKVEQQVPEEDE